MTVLVSRILSIGAALVATSACEPLTPPVTRPPTAVSLFSGLGGDAEAARLAGVRVLRADNHWDLAVRIHEMNHPDAIHVCQDLQQANFFKFPDHDILLAGPSCQGFSEASQPTRAARPEHYDLMRSTPWAVVSCVEAKRPRKFVIENVRQFVEWPLYELWLATFRKLGYHVTTQVICASSFGQAQLRERLFIVGSLAGEIHLDVPAPPVREAPFAPYIDWSVGGWKDIEECRGEERFRAAARRFGSEPCLVQHVTGHQGIPLDGSIRTVTTKVQWCVMRKNGRRWEYRYLTPRELARAQGFPDTYRLPAVRRGHVSNADLTKAVGNAWNVVVGQNVISQVAAAA
jgi:DNA (cytosine-5)-methyltransferase 1